MILILWWMPATFHHQIRWFWMCSPKKRIAEAPKRWWLEQNPFSQLGGFETFEVKRGTWIQTTRHTTWRIFFAEKICGPKWESLNPKDQQVKKNLAWHDVSAILRHPHFCRRSAFPMPTRYRHSIGLKIIGPVKIWQPKMAAAPVEEAQQIGLWPARSLDLCQSWSKTLQC